MCRKLGISPKVRWVPDGRESVVESVCSGVGAVGDVKMIFVKTTVVSRLESPEKLDDLRVLK